MPDQKNLTAKEKWELAEKLSSKLTLDKWERYAAAADMNPRLIDRKENDVEQSFSLINEAVEQNSLVALLEAVSKDYAKDDELKAIISDLQDPYRDRLERLTKMIANDQCILFLGPGVLKTNDGDNIFNEVLSRELIKRLKKSAIYFDLTQQDNLTYIVQRFYKIPKTRPGEAGSVAAKMYNSFMDNGQINESVFQKLIKIPWKLVINANADNILSEMMSKQKPGSVICRNYSIANNIDEKVWAQQINNDINDMRENKKAFFYNLFGTFDQPESILYTEANFLEFIDSVVNKAPSLHSYVTSAFDNNKHYLFLGFDFDQWYFKILAKTLKLYNREERALSLSGKRKRFSESNVDFFEEEFKFYFVFEDFDGFLTKLLKYYDKETGK